MQTIVGRKQTVLIVTSIFFVVIVLPRFVLLFNAPREEYIPDTYSGETLAIGNAFAQGQLQDYILAVHKYPLLGPYLSVPVVGLYYFYGKVANRFHGPDDLMRAYILQETDIPILFRAEVLVFNLLALFFLYLSARRVAGGSRAKEFFPLVFAALSLYVTAFSVSPRIHNLIFLFSSITLFSAISYYQRPTLLKLSLSFLSAGFAFAAAQSGFVAIALPIAAMYFVWRERRIDVSGKNVEQRVKFSHMIAGLCSFVVVSLLLGYPGALFAPWKDVGFSHFFLSPEHSQPSFSFIGFLNLVRDLLFAFELVSLWSLLAFFGLLFSSKAIKLEACDRIAAIHILFFVIIFGSSSVTVGRFSLAILPSLFFLSGRIAATLIHKKWFIVPLSTFAFASFFTIIQLTRVAFGGDTRVLAVSYIEEKLSSDAMILSTIDHNVLGILSTAASLARQDGGLGQKDKYILEHNMISSMSRNFVHWDPKKEPFDSLNLSTFSSVLLNEPNMMKQLRPALLNNGFTIINEFTPYRVSGKPITYFNWDPSERNSAFGLYSLNRFGPPIYVFSKSKTTDGS